jgi:hypothetical protein
LEKLAGSQRPVIKQQPTHTHVGWGTYIGGQKTVSTADGVYDDIPDLVWRGIENPLGLGTFNDPLGGLLLREWRTGTGPDIRCHTPRSRFSAEFIRSTSTLEHMLALWNVWLTRKESTGTPPPFRISGPSTCHRLTNGSMAFGPWQYAMAGRAAHVMGSVIISEARYLPEKDKVLWTGWNIMGTGSFMAAHLKQKLKLGPEPATIRRPKKFGATLHVLQWYADVPSWVRARAA